MPSSSLAQYWLLPGLKPHGKGLVRRRGTSHVYAEKKTPYEVCPVCAGKSHTVYDRRWVHTKDDPVRGHMVILHILKRRFWCGPCRKPFTEPIPGIKKGGRTTERYRKAVLWASENFSDLKAVRRRYRISAGCLYKLLYTELERKRRTWLYPWPKTIGIDEHYWGKSKPGGYRRFATMLVDYKGRRVMEVVNGREGGELKEALAHIPGRENVRNVVMDLSNPYRRFVREFFPNARIVADKFHVLRLLNPALNRRRKEVTGDKRSLPLRKLLLKSGKRLDNRTRRALNRGLKKHRELQEVYSFKERLHGFFRIRGAARARCALSKMTDAMAKSLLPEIQRLRKTLMRWREEILFYFDTRLTNGRTEGYNNKAKVVKKRAGPWNEVDPLGPKEPRGPSGVERAYGYRTFNNYRLRLLHACR